MSLDTNDAKILVCKSLQWVINSCRRCVRNHPRVSYVMLLLFLLYIFLPSVFEILFYSLPLVIIAAIFLAGGLSCKNPKQDEDKALNLRYARVKDEKKGIGLEELGSESISENDLMHRSLLGELPMKMLEEKNSKCSWNHSGDFQACVVFPNSEPSKLIGDLSVSDADCQDDDDEDESHEEGNNSIKAVQWNEDDQQNLMDLGTSELERNKRLESMIAKRRARKLLSMQPRRSRHRDFDGYVYHGQTPVPLIVPARAVEDVEGQPGSAPSMMLPKRNPFDLPYDPSEEKPNLTGGSFMEELFNAHQKEISFCRHESFVRGPGFMADLDDYDDDPIANSLPSFFPKPRTFGAPGLSRYRRPSDMKENEHLLGGFPSQEGQMDEMPNDSRDQAEEPSPGHEELGNSADKEFPLQVKPALQVEAPELVSDQADEFISKTDLLRNPADDKFSFQGIPVLQVEAVEPVSDQLGKTEAGLVEAKKSEDVETKESEDIETKESADEEMKDGENYSSIDMEEGVAITDEAGDEVGSSSSSEASEDIINAVKNEAFRNSVKKVLTCLIPRKRGYSSERIAHPIEPLYDSSPNAVHPTKMEERSFYTSRPLHTPTFSIASDMLVEVSEAGSPSYVAEPNSPTDRESLVYDGDVDKDNNSGDEDLWGASPHPVRLEEFGSRSRVTEIGEIGKSPLGLAAYSSHDELGLPEQQERAPISTPNEASCLKESEDVLVNLDQRANADGQGSRASISSSSDYLPDQEQGQSLVYLDNFMLVPPIDVAPSTAKEEPGRHHPETWIKQECITFEPSNLAGDNGCSLRNLDQYNSISDDDSSGQQGDTEDEKSDSRQSRRNSISPSMRPVFLVEPVPSSPDPMSQNTLVLNDESVSTDSSSSLSQHITQNPSTAAEEAKGQSEDTKHGNKVQQLSLPSEIDASTLRETPTAVEEPVAEAADESHDELTTINEHVGEAEMRHQDRNDEPISVIRHEMNLLENAESRSSISTND